MNHHIRSAHPQDACEACLVLQRSISECCTEDHRNDAAILAAWLGNKTPETVRRWIECESNHTDVALVEGKIVGIATLTRQGRIVLCYVAPEVRFTGVGKGLLQALENRAREWGLTEMQVASTVTARAFYQRNGFLAAGTTRTPFGIEAISFTKRLVGSYAKKKSCHCNHMY